MKNLKIAFAIICIILISMNLIIAQTKTINKQINDTNTTDIVDTQVKVGLYMLNIGKFDISTGAYTADFYLSFDCEHKCPEIDYEFMNGRAASVDKIIDEDKEKFYRIQANLNSQIDLKKFPFDSQKVQIIIEDKRNTIDKVEFVPDLEQSGLDDAVIITGWRMRPWTAETKVHEYKIYDEKYSQYIFTIPIYRVVLNSILKTLLPIIFIVLVMLSSFILDPDKITTRIAMVSSALVASVMFHVSLANQIPPVGYLTFVDKFMGLTYFVILISFFLNVFLLELLERKKTELVEKIHRATEFVMFIVVPIVYVLFFLLLLW